MAWHEWPLIVFTVLAQTSVGAFLVLSVLLLAKQFPSRTEQRLHKAMFGLWVVMGVGFLSSVMHLGSPFRAMNALNMVGSSWLSNEIAGGSMFFALGGLFWLLSIVRKGAEGVRKSLMLGAMAAGSFFMYSMIMVYMIDTVPTWYTGLTPAAFLLTMVVSGVALAHLLLTIAQHEVTPVNTVLPLLGLFAAFGVAISTSMLSVHLGGIQTSVTSALAIVPDLATLQFTRLAILSLGVVIWLVPVFVKKAPTVAPMAIAFVLILASELIGRGVFFGMHLSAGM
ncbi:dimethylsulfoxide reductase [Vibrio sinensis]|uniref:Dimethylsulfoxide reductase n=1 Tax=Vibrio sinensis TaxID=2302434 RepID=A0A3A6QHE3_9VIBR|nr:DmsC/YnfH family molybdoenzyme membrane anchor subunit [Vibrio sinensis]RJX71935.1 dimethylsulfoxide reductase [Vibrio sinensis]